MVGLSEKAGRGFFDDGHHDSHVDAYRPTGSYDDGPVHDGAVVESGDDALPLQARLLWRAASPRDCRRCLRRPSAEHPQCQLAQSEVHS